MPIVGEMKYDKRIIDRNLRSGLVTKDEYARHLNRLRDLSDGVIPVEAEYRRLNRVIPGTPETDEDEL